MTSSFKICPLTEALLPSAAELERVCFIHPWSEAALRESLETGRAVFLAAVEGERAVGYLGMEYVLDEGSITNVAVLPEKRRQGVARRLLEELLREAEKRFLATVTLEVREGNLPARALYEGLGFLPVGKRKNFYRDPTEDAVLMTVFLKPAE